jgi:phage gpG-like protein
MSATVTVTRDGGLQDFIRKIRKQKATLEVGFFHSDIAIIASANEYGCINGNGAIIPPRPFMQQTVDHYNDEWTEKMAKLAKKHKYNITQVFELMGEVVKDNIKMEMRDGNFTPNAPATLRQKQGDRPLFDTGRMQDSIEYDVKRES